MLIHIDEGIVALGSASNLGAVLWHHTLVQQVVTVALDDTIALRMYVYIYL